VELIAAGADAAQVANATIKVAELAFSYDRVNNDPGFNQAVWLMTQLGLAGGAASPFQHLRGCGVAIPASTSVMGVMVAFTEAMERRLAGSRIRSDLGDLAHRALVDAVGHGLQAKIEGQLFNATPEVIQNALAEYRKPKEFAKLSRTFFSRLTRECLDYYLSRTLNSQLGEGQRFTSTNEKSQFDEALATHCREASVIVEKYSAEWFDKHRYEEKGNISRESVQGFASWAMKKMTSELKAGADPNAD
jgi:hypothetical protein